MKLRFALIFLICTFLIPQTHLATQGSPKVFQETAGTRKFGRKSEIGKFKEYNIQKPQKEKKAKKTKGFNDLDRYLRLSIILLIGAIIGGILSSINGLGFFWVVSLAFGLAAVAFFVLWVLVEFA